RRAVRDPSGSGSRFYTATRAVHRASRGASCTRAREWRRRWRRATDWQRRWGDRRHGRISTGRFRHRPPPQPARPDAPTGGGRGGGARATGGGGGEEGGGGGGLLRARRGGGGPPGGGGGAPGRMRRHHPPQPRFKIPATSETRGWFEPARDAGFIRRPTNSY